MASSREILNDVLESGASIPQEWIDSAYGMKALTDQLAEKRFLERYGNIYPFVDADKVEEAIVPSIDDVIDRVLHLEEDKENKKSKADVFIEEFPKKVNEWKEKIKADKIYGENGWETVKKIWRNASNQKMLEDIAKNRKKTVNDNLYSTYASLMWPRAWEHLENTGDFTAKDMLLDLGGNVMMAIPGSAFTGLGAKAVSKLAPRAFTYFRSPGFGLGEKALKGAGGMAGNLLGNAVVPFTQEGLDAAFYDDSDEGMEHRADFSLGDAVLGTAINQGVNRGLMRYGGPLIDRFANGGMGRGGSMKARELLQNLGQSLSKSGDDLALDVAAKLRSPVVDAGQITEDAIKAARAGMHTEQAAQGVTSNAFKDAIADQVVLNAIKDGKIQAANQAAINQAKADVKKELNDEYLKSAIKNKTSTLDDAAKVLKAWSDPAIPVKKAFTYPENLDIEFKKLTDIPNLANGRMREALSKSDIEGSLGRNTDAMLNYAKWHGQGPAAANGYDKMLNAVYQGLPAWGINKYGSETDADLLLSPLPSVKKALKEERKKTQGAPANRNKSADVLKVIGENQGLTAEDQKYLNAIAKNPEIMTVGYKEDPNGFKLWLLERGNDLLSGTRVFRPTFDVE